ncbi:hypothetical protein KQX54_004931 [Cotesia glomerata]|uniref:Uncharacterized protein n=1 Tax=Cotesia glomerata TaxID=32391 RepID=A0AAV7J4V0_COTGL|nr:hypothetical protein KQX54_004931 [Cotesia glomerata]
MKDNFNWFEVEAGVNSRNLMTDMFHAPAIPFEYIEYQRNATQTKLAGKEVEVVCRFSYQGDDKMSEKDVTVEQIPRQKRSHCVFKFPRSKFRVKTNDKDFSRLNYWCGAVVRVMTFTSYPTGFYTVASATSVRASTAASFLLLLYLVGLFDTKDDKTVFITRR